MSEYTASNDYRNYLMHYGRKGMKWGEHRFTDWLNDNVTGHRYRQNANTIGSNMEYYIRREKEHKPGSINSNENYGNLRRSYEYNSSMYNRTLFGRAENLIKGAVKVTKDTIKKGKKLVQNLLSKYIGRGFAISNSPFKNQLLNMRHSALDNSGEFLCHSILDDIGDEIIPRI